MNNYLSNTLIARRTALRALASASVLALAAPFTASVQAQPVGAGFVYTADEHGGSVSRIDLGSGKVDTVALPIAPHNVQFVPAGRLVRCRAGHYPCRAASAARAAAAIGGCRWPQPVVQCLSFSATRKCRERERYR